EISVPIRVIRGQKLNLEFFGGGREAAAHGVLCNSPRQHKLQQVIRPSGLGAHAGELEAAEGLSADEGTGDLAGDVEIADSEVTTDAGQMLGAASEEAAGEGVLRAVGDGERLVQVLHFDDGEDGTKDLFLGDDGRGRDVGKDVRGDIEAFVDEEAKVAS